LQCLFAPRVTDPPDARYGGAMTASLPPFDFDLFTIGAGSGGVAASRRAGALGARVAIAEEEDIGGTCVLRGCVPKKLLVYASHFQDDLEDAEGYGWSIGPSSFDWARLIAAKDKEVARLSALYVRLLRDSRVTVVKGRATVVDAHTVEVAGQRYTAKHILVATGSHPVMPDVPGKEHALSSREALLLPRLPKRVLILGAGFIGVEFAGIFRSFGSEVTVVMRSSEVLRGFDEDIRAVLTKAMTARGVRFRPDSVVQSIERTAPDGPLSVMLAMGELIEVDAVLFATGREPNTANLGLEAAGVSLDAVGAVVVDERSRSTTPSIFAVGDCTNRVNLTPMAITEGRALVDGLFGPEGEPRAVGHDDFPSAVFSQPPVGTVGLTEACAAEKLKEIDVFVSTFRPMKNTLAGRDERTLVKLIVDRATDRVVGAHMVGPDAPEIIQGIGIAVRNGLTKAQFDRTLGIHPTAAEEFVTLREKRPAKPS
jgi:glutathione reductase (NADPH)